MTTVKHTPNPKSLPRMSKAEKAQFDALKDEDIDYSDIPELDAAFWEQARINKPSHKPKVTMRVDEDTLAFYKSGDPKGYTARMAAVLKAFAQQQQQPK